MLACGAIGCVLEASLASNGDLPTFPSPVRRKASASMHFLLHQSVLASTLESTGELSAVQKVPVSDASTCMIAYGWA